MTSEATLEVALRSVLAEQRPAHGAPSGLRERVAAIPEVLGARRWFLPPWLGRLAPVGASIASVAAVLVIVAIASRGPGIGPVPGGGPGSAAPATFDPTLEGPGILRSLDTSLRAVPGLIVVLALGAALYQISIRQSRPRWLGLRLVACAIVGVAAAMLTSFSALREGSGSAVLRGFDVQVPTPNGAPGPTQFFETAGPGDHTVVMFSIRNQSAIPVTVEGVVVEPPPSDAIPTWTAVWLARNQTRIMGDLTDIRPFTPSAVAPGGELDLYLVGKPGRCAFGPTFTLQSSISGSYGMPAEARVTYSVLGLRDFAIVQIGMEGSEPLRPNCQSG
jgi:hypothetical protein